MTTSKVEDALTAAVHMYMAVGAQASALASIKSWAETVADQLASDGLYEAQQEAAQAAQTAAEEAIEQARTFRAGVEKLQHALEAFTLSSSR